MLGVMLGVLITVGAGFSLGVVEVHHPAPSAQPVQFPARAPMGKDLVEPSANLGGSSKSAHPGKDLVDPEVNLFGSSVSAPQGKDLAEPEANLGNPSGDHSAQPTPVGP